MSGTYVDHLIENWKFFTWHSIKCYFLILALSPQTCGLFEFWERNLNQDLKLHLDFLENHAYNKKQYLPWEISILADSLITWDEKYLYQTFPLINDWSILDVCSRNAQPIVDNHFPIVEKRKYSRIYYMSWRKELKKPIGTLFNFCHWVPGIIIVEYNFGVFRGMVRLSSG